MDNAKNTRDIFDSCAKLYQDNFMEPLQYQPSLDLFSEFLTSDLKVLDVGCGPGNLSAYLQKICPEIEIFGIDLSSKMLEFAKANLPAAEFQQMDCRNIDRFQKKFDAVICGFCLPYLSKEEAVDFLQKVAKILNSEGVLYLSTMVADKYSSAWVGSSKGGNQKLLTYYHQTDHLKDTLLSNNFNVLHEKRMEEQERDGTRFKDHIIIAKKMQ